MPDADLHLSHLQSLLALEGLQVVDVGAGKGGFVSALAEVGAIATGVEPSAANIEKGQSKARLLQGGAEALPLPDNSADLITFMFSLHHVPATLFDRSFDEIRRVLKPAGRLHVVEPHVYGSMSDVLKFVDDETEVRLQSHARLDAFAEEPGVTMIDQTDYTLRRTFRDFEGFVTRNLESDASRSAALPVVKDSMRREFENRAVGSEQGYELTQSCRAFHFTVQ